MTQHEISVKKTILNGRMYFLSSYEEFAPNPEPTGDDAVIENINGKEVVLPYRGKYPGNTSVPGIYNAGCVDFEVLPTEETMDQYIPEKIITFKNSDDIKETLRKEEVIERMKEPWISSPDHITTLPISKDDCPEMKNMKMAINAKHIDLDKYAGRFGDNFPNDKRQLKNKSLTLNILERFCNNLDMEAVLILRDKSGNVPNPMNCSFEVSLTDQLSDVICYEDKVVDDGEDPDE
jgi:hypothetical protein